jgi:phosphoserine phosphatase
MQLVLTALADDFSSHKLAALRGFAQQHGDVSDEELVPAGTIASCACARYFLTTAADPLELRRQATATFPKIDFAVRTVEAFRTLPKLAAFDMDSTLITCEVIDELAKLAGVGEQVSALTAAAMRGELDFQQSFRQRIGLLRGLDVLKVERLLETICLTEGTERLFRALRERGCKTAILSGGFSFVGRRLQAKLGIDFVHTNKLDIADGCVAGTVTCEIVDGASKAEFLKSIAEQEGIALAETIAVGDGANDLPMLQLAGLGVAYRAKPALREEARAVINNVALDGVLCLWK